MAQTPQPFQVLRCDCPLSVSKDEGRSFGVPTGLPRGSKGRLILSSDRTAVLGKADQ